MIDIRNNTTHSEFDFSIIHQAAFLTLSAHKSEGYELSILLTNDDHIAELNQEYRSIDSPTDVLAFPMLENDDNSLINSKILGDVVISLETAERQAKTEKHPLEDEVAFLTVHGILHLLGYNHHTSEDARKMFSEQTAILQKMQVNIKSTYQSRESEFRSTV